MKNEKLVTVDPEKYGITSTKAKEISKMFKPMLDLMEALEDEANDIKARSGEITPHLCAEARVARLKYAKARTGTAAIHKEIKAFYLKGGRYVDGWKNAQAMAAEGAEK